MKRNSLDVITVQEKKSCWFVSLRDQILSVSVQQPCDHDSIYTTKAHIYHARESRKLGDFQVL